MGFFDWFDPTDAVELLDSDGKRSDENFFKSLAAKVCLVGVVLQIVCGVVVVVMKSSPTWTDSKILWYLGLIAGMIVLGWLIVWPVRLKMAWDEGGMSEVAYVWWRGFSWLRDDPLDNWVLCLHIWLVSGFVCYAIVAKLTL